MISALFYFYALCFGAIWGSFINVVIYRLPREESTIFPRSHCPSCNKLIRWYENIPLLSFLWLKGRCSQCRSSISWQYPIVEIFSALISGYFWPHEITTYSVLLYFFSFLVATSFLAHFIIDLKHYILPDEITLFLAALFLAHSLLHNPWSYSFLGAFIGWIFPFSVAYFYLRWRSEIGLGLGDVKLFGVLGIYLGPLGILQNIFLSCMVGSVISLFLLLWGKIGRKTPVPFGPYIILTASIQIFFPDFLQPLYQLFLP